ncbi:MAG: hypothetical protein WC871_08295 [Bacteroidales bacterium]|jgi:hypothetical protein
MKRLQGQIAKGKSRCIPLFPVLSAPYADKTVLMEAFIDDLKEEAE